MVSVRWLRLLLTFDRNHQEVVALFEGVTAGSRARDYKLLMLGV
jgi:hypothetical protein